MISHLLTQRKNVRHLSYDLVYEWEDVIARSLGWDLIDDVRKGLAFRILRRLSPRAAGLFKHRCPCLIFEMLAGFDPSNNKENIVPCVIDFFFRSSRELARFYRTYSRNPVVLISSREAFDFLQDSGCPLNIRHWALSIPDDWIQTDDACVEKKYDVVVAGRANPVLRGFLDRYRQRHPSLRCLTRCMHEGKFYYQDSQTGTLIDGENRVNYRQVLRESKVGLYATPAMDGCKASANGFNQVTPRFLELIASGCHILARYPSNSDTAYYGVSDFSPFIETYEQFERELDARLSKPVDWTMTNAYIRKHLTSTRARELVDLLKECGL